MMDHKEKGKKPEERNCSQNNPRDYAILSLSSQNQRQLENPESENKIPQQLTMLRDPQQGSQQAFQQTLQSQAARGCIQGLSAVGCVISITEEAGRKRMVGSKPKWLTKKKIAVKKVLSRGWVYQNVLQSHCQETCTLRQTQEFSKLK